MRAMRINRKKKECANAPIGPFTMFSHCVYGYNIRNELVSATKNAEGAKVLEYQYQYDDIGNRETSSERGTNIVYTANNLNQYTSISNSAASALSAGEFIPHFDDDGNHSTNSSTPNSPTPSLLSMSYDRMGRRVTKNNRRFIYDGYLCIGKIEDSISIHYSLSPIHYFVWDPTEPVATRPLAWWTLGHLFGGHEPDLGKTAQEKRWPEAERATKKWIKKWNEHCKLKDDCKDKCVWEYVK